MIAISSESGGGWKGFLRVLILVISTSLLSREGFYQYCCSWIDKVLLPLCLSESVGLINNISISDAGWYSGAGIIIETSIIARGAARKPALLACWPTDQLVCTTTNYVIGLEEETTNSASWSQPILLLKYNYNCGCMMQSRIFACRGQAMQVEVSWTRQARRGKQRN